MNELKSPCKLVCSIDMASGYCFGCGRTRDEIAQWINLSDTQRDVILDTLDGRLATIVRKPRRQTRRQKLALENGQEIRRVTRFEAEQ